MDRLAVWTKQLTGSQPMSVLMGSILSFQKYPSDFLAIKAPVLKSWMIDAADMRYQ
jgi:hypothetical protein